MLVHVHVRAQEMTIACARAGESPSYNPIANRTACWQSEEEEEIDAREVSILGVCLCG